MNLAKSGSWVVTAACVAVVFVMFVVLEDIFSGCCGCCAVAGGAEDGDEGSIRGGDACSGSICTGTSGEPPIRSSCPYASYGSAA